MSYIKKEKLIKADMASIENRVRHAFNQGYNLGYKDGKISNLEGVDLIDREMAIEGAWDTELAGLDNRKIVNMLKDLPPVTPQPRKGEWLRMSDLSEQEDNRYKCSRCGNVVRSTNKMNLYTFNSWCGRCGSDNGRYINYEVEE